jgi:hypothetical protein
LVTPDTAIVVRTQGRGEAEVVQDLADSLLTMANDESMRMAMAGAAIAHAQTDMSWESRANGALVFIREALRGN